MKRYWPLLALLLLFSSPLGLYADVTLTDQQAQDLNQSLDELEEVLKMQSEEITDLKKQNEQLQIDSENKQKQNEQLQADSENKQKLLDEQENIIAEAKSSYKKQSVFSILQSILISICSICAGILIGIFL